MKYLILIAALLAAGCQKPEDMANNQVSRLVYTKDPRTNLCFAHLDPMNGGNFTSVACTSEVETLSK
jgi:hypothetical protein